MYIYILLLLDQQEMPVPLDLVAKYLRKLNTADGTEDKAMWEW